MFSGSNILVLLVLWFTTGFFSANYEFKNEMVWNQHDPLNWLDFEAHPASWASHDALTSSSIFFSLEYNEAHYNVTVYSSFIKGESWVKEEHANGHLLNHEQGHFDLTEIYTRMLRKEIETYAYQGNRLQKDYNRIYNLYFDSLTDAQKQYDKETDHSRDKVAQRQWDAHILEQLAALATFDETRFSVQAR